MESVRYAVKFGFLLVLPPLLLVACMDDTPTEFSGDPPRAATIQDALHDDGNPFVFLKPPVVEQPSSDLFGTFNPDLHPVVEVCHLNVPDPGDCELLTTNDGSNEPARYTVDGGPGGEIITVDAVAEEYQVQIHFVLFDLLQDETYRIVTRVGAKQLAFADVVVVSPQEMRNADTETDIVFTNDQKTVPWKVRIDQGALCWDPGETVVSCTSSTVVAGEEETVTLTSSDGEEVDFHLPSGWTATVDGETQEDELTISIEEVLAVHGTEDDPACFALFSLDDPETGEPSNCYLVRADTDTDTDVTVQFGGSLPILAFCPDSQVLQAIADGVEGWIMTSVEEDAAGTATRTYANVQPASDFGGCPLPDPTVAFGDGIVGSLASTLWTHVRPVMTPLLPRPLHAADIGFGGSIDELGTIFFWSRTPTALVVGPSSPSVAVGQTVQLTVDPVFHEDATSGGTFDVQWSSANTNVASVDATGVVTGVSASTVEITATAVNISDPSGEPVSGSTTVTVNAQAGAPASFECAPDPAGGGDQIFRGFYIPSYEGFEISQIDLFFNADAAGEYTFSLTMSDGAFDGTVLGTAQATVTLDGTGSQVGKASFVFTGATGLTGKTLAFAIEKVSGPTATVFYNMGGFPLDPTAATSCPVVETEDTSPPLSTDRRNGIGITVVGAPVTIDGVLSAGEWDGATTVDFDANVPDGSGGTTTTPATLFILNDNTNLYLAVQFARSVVDDGTNLLNFEFDHDNDGVGPEDGDDYITFSLSTGQLSDAHRSSGGSAVTTDGIRHGEGAFHNDETHSVYEISHPLNSGETGQDLALTPPSTVGMLMQLQIGSVSTRKPDGMFPTYMPITID